MTREGASIFVRPREPRDDAAIAAVVAAAFGGDAEARLVEALRRDGDCVCERVALGDGDAIVGHILFSRLEVMSASQSLKAAALAPFAVRPDLQRRGVGDTLTRAGLQACRDAGYELAVVLGHPNYYARFGFSALLAKLLDAPYAGEAFMALELKPRAIDGLRWKVAYPRAFSGPINPD